MLVAYHRCEIEGFGFPTGQMLPAMCGGYHRSERLLLYSAVFATY